MSPLLGDIQKGKQTRPGVQGERPSDRSLKVSGQGVRASASISTKARVSPQPSHMVHGFLANHSGYSLMQSSPPVEYQVGCIVSLQSPVLFIETVCFLTGTKPQDFVPAPCTRRAGTGIQLGECERAGGSLSAVSAVSRPAVIFGFNVHR